MLEKKKQEKEEKRRVRLKRDSQACGISLTSPQAIADQALKEAASDPYMQPTIKRSSGISAVARSVDSEEATSSSSDEEE